jgi:hypothetical protein
MNPCPSRMPGTKLYADTLVSNLPLWKAHEDASSVVLEVAIAAMHGNHNATTGAHTERERASIVIRHPSRKMRPPWNGLCLRMDVETRRMSSIISLSPSSA